MMLRCAVRGARASSRAQPESTHISIINLKGSIIRSIRVNADGQFGDVWPIPGLNVQVFAASLAERPQQVLLLLILHLRTFGPTKISIWEAVGFDNASHDFLRVCDDVGRGK